MQRLSRVASATRSTFASRHASTAAPSALHESVRKFEDSVSANVFDDACARARMSKSDYSHYRSIVNSGRPLDGPAADALANAIKGWALERGAMNFSFLWHPMGLNTRTAELHKKMAVMKSKGFGVTGESKFLWQLDGGDLMKGESDGSSFPSGGLRATHRAGGYLSFDPSAAVFVKDDTVFLPATFTAWTGEAIDERSVMLRSIDALSRSVTRLLKSYGQEATLVTSAVGVEQEFFLIDREHYLRRPDLLASGRTLLGASPARGQQLADHYMGNLQPRVKRCLAEFEEEMWKLGQDIGTRHTEVAPAQHEIAPVFCSSNVALDGNMLAMQVLEEVACKHGLAALCHEKPFQGVNGSGKHNNWSITAHFADGGSSNLLDPGKSEKDQERFMLFLAASVKGLNDHADIIRACIAVPGNDFRLGACEAPPGIISMYTGDELATHIQKVLAGGELAGYGISKQDRPLGVGHIAPLRVPSDDRNRTSPFPFTQNRFEFRAVGGSQSIAIVQTMLCAMMADACDALSAQIEAAVKSGKTRQQAIIDVTKQTLRDNERIIFNGNGYSEEWKSEAVQRGLKNITNGVDALLLLDTPKNQALFAKHGIYSQRELSARASVSLENYAQVVEIEARTTLDMVKRYIVPAAFENQTRMSASIAAAKAAGASKLDAQVAQVSEFGAMVDDVFAGVAALQKALDAFSNLGGGHGSSVDSSVLAIAARDTLAPSAASLRKAVDALEQNMDSKLYPFPSYEQLLTLRTLAY